MAMQNAENGMVWGGYGAFKVMRQIMAQRDHNYKKKKKVVKPKHVTSRVRRDHPRCPSATWICMCDHTKDLNV